MKPPSPEDQIIYLLEGGEHDTLVWCNDPAPGAGMDESDAIGPYIHRDSIYFCPECGDSGEGQIDFDFCMEQDACLNCPKYIDKKCSQLIPSCPCLKNPNSIASIKRGG